MATGWLTEAGMEGAGVAVARGLPEVPPGVSLGSADSVGAGDVEAGGGVKLSIEMLAGALAESGMTRIFELDQTAA